MTSALRTFEPAWPDIARVPLRRPLTRMESVVVSLLALGYNYKQCARMLAVSYQCVKFHCLAAAAKIPGDLPAQNRVIVWFRGAPREVLTGEHLFASP
jgi:DNA-binding CsgD family transcriptional regulator